MQACDSSTQQVALHFVYLLTQQAVLNFAQQSVIDLA